MIELRVHEADAAVTIDDEGLRHLMIRDPLSSITIHVGMPEEAAKQLAEVLIGSPITIVPAGALNVNGGLH